MGRMMRKILLISPEIPTGGGTGNFFWQTAQAIEKYTDWEAHIISPSNDIAKQIGADLSGFYPTGLKSKKMFSKKKQFELINLSSEISKKEDFDLTYMYGSFYFPKFHSKLKYFNNIICGLHTMNDFIGKFDKTKAITEQFENIRRTITCKKLLGISDKISKFHLISKLDERIWKKLTDQENYVVYPNLLWEENYFGMNFSERSDKILLSGRVTNPQKGSLMAKEFFEKSNFEFVLTVPINNLPIAKRLFGRYNNVEIKSIQTYQEIVEEIGRYKVFCNFGTYGPFDLTTTEAASQGCQIVAGNCIGASEYIDETFISTEYTFDCYSNEIEKALSCTKQNKSKILTARENISDMLEKFHTEVQ